MRDLLVATQNPGKFNEISEVLDGGDFKLVFLRDMDVSDRGFVEDGETFEENALKKARFFADKTGMLTLAEDSGLMVSALVGELGVKTRRWGAGEHASDEEWIEHFMERMNGVEDRGAKFVCSACVVDGEVERFFEGETLGIITSGLEAEILPGLPLSSCFLPEGCGRVYAALSSNEKNKVSHRGKMLMAVREFLENGF